MTEYLSDNNIDKRTEMQAIVAFVLSVFGMMFFGVLGIFSIILGINAKKAIKKNTNLDGSGLANIAIIFGIFDLVLWFSIFLIYIIAIFLLLF